MNFFEFLVVIGAFSTFGYVVHTFFSYLRFRRGQIAGKGKDLEELAEAFEFYMRKTSKRIEQLESIIADEPQAEQKTLERTNSEPKFNSHSIADSKLRNQLD